MRGPSLIRAAIAVAILGAALVGYRWWQSPERLIRGILADTAAALTHTEPDTDLRALAAIAGLQHHLTADVIVDAGGRGPLRGRQDVLATAARLRASSPMLRVRFFDADIRIDGDAAAEAQATVEITSRDGAGEESAAAREVAATFVKQDGRWQVASARLVLPADDPR